MTPSLILFVLKNNFQIDTAGSLLRRLWNLWLTVSFSRVSLALSRLSITLKQSTMFTNATDTTRFVGTKSTLKNGWLLPNTSNSKLTHQNSVLPAGWKGRRPKGRQKYCEYHIRGTLVTEAKNNVANTG